MMQGNHVYEVPNGYKLKITPGGSGLRVQKLIYSVFLFSVSFGILVSNQKFLKSTPFICQHQPLIWNVNISIIKDLLKFRFPFLVCHLVQQSII